MIVYNWGPAAWDGRPTIDVRVWSPATAMWPGWMAAWLAAGLGPAAVALRNRPGVTAAGVAVVLGRPVAGSHFLGTGSHLGRA